MKNANEVMEWLKQNVKNYCKECFVVNEYLIIDFFQNENCQKIDLKGLNLKNIPVRFGKIFGELDVRDNKLTDLKWLPQYVSNDFFLGGGNFENVKFEINELDDKEKEIEGGSKVKIPFGNLIIRLTYNKIWGIPYSDISTYPCLRKVG